MLFLSDIYKERVPLVTSQIRIRRRPVYTKLLGNIINPLTEQDKIEFIYFYFFSFFCGREWLGSRNVSDQPGNIIQTVGVSGVFVSVVCGRELHCLILKRSFNVGSLRADDTI